MNAKTEVAPEALSARTLKTALMQITLDELKNAQDVWPKLSETEQDEILTRLDKRVADAAKQTHELFATAGVARVVATVESVTVKDGIKVQLTIGRHDAQRHEVFDAQGQTVYLVLANPEQFTDAPHEHKADADQAALDLKNNLDRIGDSDEAQAQE